MVLEAGHRGRSITLILEDQLKKSQVAERPTGRRSSQVLERMSWNELSKPLQLGRTLEGRTTARYANCSMT
ncbi:hypothetical protein YC2023_005167 [Brassica napus]